MPPDSAVSAVRVGGRKVRSHGVFGAAPYAQEIPAVVASPDFSQHGGRQQGPRVCLFYYNSTQARVI